MFKLTPFATALCMAASAGIGTSALAEDSSQGRPSAVVVLPFATLGAQSPNPGDLSGTACIAPQGSPVPTAEAIDATVRSGLPAQLTTALSREVNDGGPTVYHNLQDAPAGSLIIAGCIVRADPGDSAKRLIGVGLGASVLAVHVRVYRGGGAHLERIGEFDSQVEGENKLPPIGPVGLAVHGIRGLKLTLAGDADKLAKLIAKRVLTGQTGA